MPSMRLMINNLRKDFPDYKFELANGFWWSATKETIFYDDTAPNSSAFTLHELSHAILGHRGYERDIELLKLEREAWSHAQTNLANRYGVSVTEDIIQDNLDTYRQWLHARSTCPMCDTTGLQSKDALYRCFACGHKWRVNEARICALRRHSLQTK